MRFLRLLPLLLALSDSAWGQVGSGPGLIGPNPPNPYILASGVTANVSFPTSLPANAYIQGGRCAEYNGNAATVAFGSTSGGSDVAPAFSVPAGGTTTATAQAFSKVWFSRSATQVIYATPTGIGFSLSCTISYQVGP